MNTRLQPLLKERLPSAVAILCLVIVTAAVSGQQRVAKIPDGTIIRVIIIDSLNSGTSHQNDRVHFEVAEDVMVSGVIVIAKGAPALGHVTEAEPKGKWGHEGKLAFTVDYAKAVDGTNVRLRASSAQGGGDSKAALMLGLSGAFKHGKDIDVAKGTAMDAYVDGDREVSTNPS